MGTIFMSEPLLNDLAGAKLREKSGSRVADRYDFQKDWALCFLLELHSQRSDYVVLFDYIDDVVVLDSATTPKEMEFYQIKTKRSGEFKLKDILNRKKSPEGLSILGKLAANKIQFPSTTKSLNLVCNVPFNFELNSGTSSADMTPICLSDLAVRSIDTALQQIKEEHKLSVCPDVKDITLFLVTDLSLLAHSEHARGKLNDFLHRLYPDKPLPVTAVYKTLFGEVTRKNNKVLSCPTPEELLKQKAITRSELSQLIESLPKDTEIKQRLLDVWNQLRHENVPYPKIEQLKGAVIRYELQRPDKTNQALVQLTREVRSILDILKGSAQGYATLCEKLDLVVQKVKKQAPQIVSVYSDQEIKGIIIFEDNNE